LIASSSDFISQKTEFALYCTYTADGSSAGSCTKDIKLSGGV
jgi:hypothetical protein